jgi:hypothetical protein
MDPNTNNGPLRPEPPKKMTPEEVEFVRDMKWAVQDPEVTAKYPDEYVAVWRRKIIAHGEDREAVLAEAQRITGLPRHEIPITVILGPGILFSPR